MNYAEGKVAGLSAEGATAWVNNALHSSDIMPAGFVMSGPKPAAAARGVKATTVVLPAAQ